MNILYILLIGLIQSCPNKDERCASCLGTKCHYCYDGYISDAGTCLVPTKRVDNCLTYSADGECK